MSEIIPNSKVPSATELAEAVNAHHSQEAELLKVRRSYRDSIDTLDRLFARSIGYTLKLSGEVVSVNFIVSGERLPQEKAGWNESYFGPLRPDLYVVTGAPIETEFEAAMVTPPEAPPQGPELLVAYHSLQIYSTTREMKAAQRVFDREHSA